MLEEEEQVAQKFPPGYFQHIFWQQQKKAASRSAKEKRGMCWHPLMIKWCLYLRHQSSKAYETLRESGCIHRSMLYVTTPIVSSQEQGSQLKWIVNCCKLLTSVPCHVSMSKHFNTELRTYSYISPGRVILHVGVVLGPTSMC